MSYASKTGTASCRTRDLPTSAIRDVWAANNGAPTLDLHDDATIAGRCCLLAVGCR